MAGTKVTINRRVIEQLTKDIQREFDRNPIRVPIHGDDEISSGSLPDPHTAIGLHCVQVLDWLHQNPTQLFAVRSFLPVIGIDSTADPDKAPAWLSQVVSILGDSGLVNVSQVWGSYLDYSLRLSDRGIRDFAEREARRQNKSLRRAICRRGILRWLDDESGDITDSLELPQIFTTPWGTFEGDLFTVDEVLKAQRYLADKGLITSQPLELTASGIDCVENFDAQISRYLASKDGNPMTVNQNHFNNISGSQIAIGNRDVQQDQTNGTAPADLISFVTALRNVIAEVPEEQAADLSKVADQIEDEASRDIPDQTWLLRLAERVRRILGGIQGITAVAGVIEQADQTIRTLGG